MPPKIVRDPQRESKRLALKPVDLRILQFIQSHSQAQGVPPSHRQIQSALNIDYLIIVQRSIHRLKLAGHLVDRAKYTRGKAGVLEVREEQTDNTQVPLLGLVAAGRPIEAIEDRKVVEVPAWMMSKKEPYFVLQVKGNSMIEDGIFDQDLVLIRKQDQAKNGDTVVALIDNEATLKKFYKKSDSIILKPANSELNPIEVTKEQNFRIAGIFAGVLRSVE